MRKFAVFDIDGTVYREAMSFIVAEEILTRYEFPVETAKLAEARNTYQLRGSTEAYWAYNSAMLSICEKVIPHVTPAQLNEIIDYLLTSRGGYCYAYSLQLIKQCKAENRALIAISGSIRNIIEPFALSLGFDYVVASELEVVDGAYTGKRSTQTKQGKDIVLRTLAGTHNLTFDGSLGVGDTHRDSAMLKTVKHAIAFNPNAALYDEAVRHSWQIVLERKNMIYELSKQASGYELNNAHPIYDDNHNEAAR